MAKRHYTCFKSCEPQLGYFFILNSICLCVNLRIMHTQAQALASLQTYAAQPQPHTSSAHLVPLQTRAAALPLGRELLSLLKAALLYNATGTHICLRCTGIYAHQQPSSGCRTCNSAKAPVWEPGIKPGSSALGSRPAATNTHMSFGLRCA